MENLSDEALIESHAEAMQLKLDPHFIKLLERERQKRIIQHSEVKNKEQSV